MVELGNGIMDAYKLRRIAQGAPDHIEPVSLGQLLCLVPFVRGQPYRLSTQTSLDLYSFDEDFPGGFIGDFTAGYLLSLVGPSYVLVIY